MPSLFLGGGFPEHEHEYEHGHDLPPSLTPASHLVPHKVICDNRTTQVTYGIYAR